MTGINLKKTSSISFKVVIFLITFSTIFTILSVSFQLKNNYIEEVKGIKDQMNLIERGYSYALAIGMWNYDEVLIDKLVIGIIDQPNIVSLELPANDYMEYKLYGEKVSLNTITHKFKLIYHGANVGSVKLTATTDAILKNNMEMFNVTLLTEIIKILLISICIFVMIYKLITRHLNAIMQYFSSKDKSWLDHPLVLKQFKNKRSHRFNEIHQILKTINNLREDQLKYISNIKIAEEKALNFSQDLKKINYELTIYKNNLEDLVSKRTSELNESLNNLKTTQNELIESAKMSSMGQLVMGVAHELNTPMGISITATSFLIDTMDELTDKFREEKLTKSTLIESFESCTQTSHLILDNLSKGAKLIDTFKKISVNDGLEDEKRSLNLELLISDVVLAKQSTLTRMGIDIAYSCPPDLTFFSHPVHLFNILSSLILNTIEHAFDDTSYNKTIIITAINEEFGIKLFYKDSGTGIPKNAQGRIFDAFFTTNRGKGHPGLGLHIVYNLISQAFKGHIKCNCDSGTEFEIWMPFDS